MSAIVKGKILFDAVLPSPAWNEYMAAMRDELDWMAANQVWELIDLSCDQAHWQQVCLEGQT